MMTENVISREEVLGGMSGRAAKQASALLVLIEGQTAYLIAQSRQAMTEFPTEQAAVDRDRAFLEAIALEREPPIPPTIQDLERWAPQWASLLPENPTLRAMVAHLLGEKYTFTRRATPRLQAALNLNTAVQNAYQLLYAMPLDTIFADQERLAQRLRWMWAYLARWLDELPPFWTAFSLTLTNTVGSSVLALPIALAQVGPLAGVAILVVLGLVNMLTIAWTAEAFTRTGSLRYGKSFVGRIVSDYLGRGAATLLSVSTLVYCVLALFAYYIGFSSTLAGVSPIPAWAWTALLFLVNVYFARRKTLTATVVSALVIGAINISLILILSLLALSQAQSANLLYVALPWLNGRRFDPALLQLAFGVVLGVYASHLSVSNCAQVVLQRDPGGQALMRGTVAAQLTAIALFCVWVVGVNSAIAPTVLAKETGTALVPLTAQLGTLVRVVGVLYVLLGIGMISIHTSLSLFNLSQEWMTRLWPAARRLGERQRELLLLSPLTLIFLATEWLLLTGTGSFALVSSLRGALVAPLLAGIFPALLLVATRRKGELAPGKVYRWLGNLWLIGCIYLLFLASIFLHSLVIWNDLPRRVIALMVGVLLLALTFSLVRRGVLAHRAVIELRHDQRKGRASSFALMAGGAPLVAAIQLEYTWGEQQHNAANGEVAFALLRSARFNLPPRTAQELKVWTHRITPEGDSLGLSGQLVLRADGEQHMFDLASDDGQIVIQLSSAASEIEIRLEKEPS